MIALGRVGATPFGKTQSMRTDGLLWVEHPSKNLLDTKYKRITALHKFHELSRKSNLDAFTATP